jgi:hypothetical protein
MEAGGLVHLIIVIMVICAVIGIAYIVMRQAGVVIPGWIVQIFWICLAVVIGIIAIRYVAAYL